MGESPRVLPFASNLDKDQLAYLCARHDGQWNWRQVRNLQDCLIRRTRVDEAAAEMYEQTHPRKTRPAFDQGCQAARESYSLLCYSVDQFARHDEDVTRSEERRVGKE